MLFNCTHTNKEASLKINALVGSPIGILRTC